MRSISKILVPVDFSPHSAAAVAHATILAQRYGSTVVLLHVFQPLSYALPDPQHATDHDSLASARTELALQLAQTEHDARAAGARHVEATLVQGFIVPEILRMARELGVDLIVMGAHGRSGVHRLLIGSVAENLMRRSPCPVLSIMAEATPANTQTLEVNA